MFFVNQIYDLGYVSEHYNLDFCKNQIVVAHMLEWFQTTQPTEPGADEDGEELTGSLTHAWWGYGMVRPLSKTAVLII